MNRDAIIGIYSAVLLKLHYSFKEFLRDGNSDIQVYYFHSYSGDML